MVSIMPPEPDDKTDPLDAFLAGALEALDFAWSAIHVMRFAACEDNFSGADNFYYGVMQSRLEIDKLRAEYRTQREQAVD